MKAKELKEWATGLHDDAAILVKERSSFRFSQEFTMRASLVSQLTSNEEEEAVIDAEL